VNPDRFYAIVDHTADIGIRLEARDPAGIFSNAARAMFDLMFGLGAIGGSERRLIEVTAESPGELLVAWLNEVLYVHAADRLVFRDFADACLSEGRFSAWGVGEKYDPTRHRGEMEIKAATYHQLVFEKVGGVWTAQIIFDV
jgi:SHS2 domain-containing protein